MKLDPQINRLLRKVWPRGQRVSFWSDNQNLDRQGKPKGPPWSGLAHLDVDGRTATRIEWELGKFGLGAHLHVDDEDGLGLHLAVPLVSVFATFSARSLAKLEEQVIFDVRLIEESLHWKFGGKDGEWNNTIPRWREGSVNLRTAILGKTRHVRGKSKLHKVKIPMPEGCYAATIDVHDDVWHRPFARTRRARVMEVRIPLGIPHQGKGENDYDMGEDAIFGWGGECSTIEEAIGRTVTDALRFRERYDSKGLRAVYPSPAKRAKQVAEERRAAKPIPAPTKAVSP